MSNETNNETTAAEPPRAKLNTREAARSAFFSAEGDTTIADRELTIEIGGSDLTVSLRAPSIADRGEVFRRAGIGRSRVKGKGKAREQETEIDMARLQAHAVIACTYVRDGEGEAAPLVRLFTLEDEDGLLGKRCGSAFDALAEPAMEMINADEDEIRKNFARTTASNGSTSSSKR